jgi:hypothetical protein
VFYLEPRHQRTISDPLRKYYFGVVMEFMAEDTGHSKEVIHEDMKRRYSSYMDDHGILVIESVFSNQSRLLIDEKQAFIRNVKRWAFDFLDLVIPEPNEPLFQSTAEIYDFPK